jgi:hypothetical protein
MKLLLRVALPSLVLSCILSASMAAQSTVLPGANLYVSVQGNDRNPGTAARPFASLHAAQEAVRRLRAKGLPAGGATVWVGDGLYLLDHGFALSKEDSGEPGRPVTYRAEQGAHPRLFGGVRLDGAGFKPVVEAATLGRLSPVARGHVVQLKLDGGMARPERYPELFKGNGGMDQLIVDGSIQPLARWPNRGYTTMASVVDSGMSPKPHGGTFHYRPEVAPHIAAWSSEAQRGNLWLTGFWRVPFEIYSLRVGSIDPAQQTITFARSGLGSGEISGIGSKYSPTVNGTRVGDGKEQYYVSNIVEEIDRPGEWSYDFPTQTIYFWPPTGGLHEVLLANLSTAVVLLAETHDVVLQGLTIEGGLTQGVTITGGVRDLVAGNTVRTTGGGGIDVEGGSSDVVQSNDLLHLGDYGIRVVAGDRKSLTPSHDIVDNNHIYLFGEQERITDGIYLDGVGVRATHNLIHDGPYNGVRYAGNDQYMAYNEIHHIGLDAGDMGVFYTNGDWAGQGNRIEYNFGHHSPNANGAYLDDGSSGRMIVGNVFYKLSTGLFLGGGHDNVFENNLIIACKTAIHIDNRGVSRHYDATAHHLTNFLTTINPNSPPWSTRYPGFLNDILADPTQPTGNVVQTNAIVDPGMPYQVSRPAVVDAAKNPVLAEMPRFANLSKLNFSLPVSSELYKEVPGFKPIPFAEIGLRRDAYRTVLPTDEETGRTTDRQSIRYFDSNTDVKASDNMGKPKP